MNIFYLLCSSGIHRERRKFLRTTLRQLTLVFTEEPGLLGPKVSVFVSVTWAKGQFVNVTWAKGQFVSVSWARGQFVSWAKGQFVNGQRSVCQCHLDQRSVCE